MVLWSWEPLGSNWLLLLVLVWVPEKQTLSQGFQSTSCLVGEPGIGKAAAAKPGSPSFHSEWGRSGVRSTSGSRRCSPFHLWWIPLGAMAAGQPVGQGE